MSVLQFLDAFNTPELQIWHNAAFENGESEDSTANKASWSNLASDFVNRSFESDCSKENQSPPALMNSSSSVSLKSAASIVKPFLHSSNTQGKPLKRSFEAPTGKSKTEKVVKQEADQAKKREEIDIDAEIEEIEKEIGRLLGRLESLRLEKAEQTARSIALRGRLVPEKFVEQKQTFKNQEAVTKIEDSSFSSAKPKLNRRGVSLGPAEIFSATKSRQPGKPEKITPLQSIHSRRKSCFWKLQIIDEEKVTKVRGRMSLSLSPKSRKAASKVQAQKQAATTVGSKRAVKKEEAILSTIQPKKLFKDGEESVTAKKPLKSGRIVANRYSQISNNQPAEKDARKRSLSEKDKEESNRCEKRRAWNENGADGFRNQKSESRLKKRWEVPGEVLVYNGEVIDETPSVAKIINELRKIRTLRCIAESPRDSGAAKRFSELVGRKSYFSTDEDACDTVCQSLSFEAVNAED